MVILVQVLSAEEFGGEKRHDQNNCLRWLQANRTRSNPPAGTIDTPADSGNENGDQERSKTIRQEFRNVCPAHVLEPRAEPVGEDSDTDDNRLLDDTRGNGHQLTSRGTETDGDAVVLQYPQAEQYGDQNQYAPHRVTPPRRPCAISLNRSPRCSKSLNMSKLAQAGDRSSVPPAERSRTPLLTASSSDSTRTIVFMPALRSESSIAGPVAPIMIADTRFLS